MTRKIKATAAIIGVIAVKYCHNISKHQIGVESMNWRKYEQLYTKEERDKMYYEEHPRMVYAGGICPTIHANGK